MERVLDILKGLFDSFLLSFFVLRSLVIVRSPTCSFVRSCTHSPFHSFVCLCVFSFTGMSGCQLVGSLGNSVFPNKVFTHLARGTSLRFSMHSFHSVVESGSLHVLLVRR